MQIEKSFQLLSADSGKATAEEARRQSAGDDTGEFGELFGAELDSQGQQSQAGADKQSGQEVAVLFREQSQAIESPQASKTQQGKIGSSSAELVANNAASYAAKDDPELLSVLAETGFQNNIGQATEVTVNTDTEQSTSSTQLLSIISQSIDFSEILVQPFKASNAATNADQLSSAEMLAAEVLGLPATAESSDALVTTSPMTINTLDADVENLHAADPAIAAVSLVTEETSGAVAGQVVAKNAEVRKVIPDPTLLKIAAGDQDAKTQQAELAMTDGSVNAFSHSDKIVSTPLTQLAAEQKNQKALLNEDKTALLTTILEPDQTDSVKPGAGKQVDIGVISIATPAATSTGSQVAHLQLTAESGLVQQAQTEEKMGKSSPLSAEQKHHKALLDGDKTQLQTTILDSDQIDSVKPGIGNQVDIGVISIATPAATATDSQVPPSQLTVESGLIQQAQTEDKVGKSSPTAPLYSDLPIDVIADVQEQSSAMPTGAATISATLQAKNAPQSFAQFQKAANMAAAIVQKQQLQVEQTQSQPQQELAAQQPVKFTELNPAIQGHHSDSPIALNTLLQTERPTTGSGGSAGSSAGQQQQQAASQLFAAKLNDSVNNQQPALNLLEPNAASQLKERVMFQVNQKIHTAEIKLAPEELGNMQIKVQLQQEQLSVQFVVQQAGAKEALEQQMPRLREMLQEQGIELTEGQVSQQRERSDEQRQARERNYGVSHGTAVDDEPMLQQAMIKVSDRMVDYYA
jgi:flagellar hook-length control protein FliK